MDEITWVFGMDCRSVEIGLMGSRHGRAQGIDGPIGLGMYGL